MTLSRRRLLGIGVVLSAAAASWGASRALTVADRQRIALVLPDAPTGVLQAPVVDALVAAAEGVIGYPIQSSHYAEYYRWRAEHLRGYQALYNGFRGAVDRDARRLAGRTFAECTPALRQRILARAARARDPRGVWDTLRADLLDRPWALYDRYVLGETLALFARTDAWALIGYDGWPGIPRGLDRYRRAPG